MNETENTQLLQSGYEMFSTGDIDGLLKLFADEIMWEVPEIENAPFAGKRSGKDSVRDFFKQLNDSEEITEFVPKEFVAQDNKVVVVGRSVSTVRSTGKTYSTDWVHVFEMYNGKVTSFHEFFDNAAATKAFQMAATA